MDALQKISESCLKNELPSFEVGDTVRVQVKIKEGDKERLQAFEGTVIGIKKGGINSTFTVRRVSHGCGVERVFPMHSPNVAEVVVTRNGKVRRSKLYYLRDRVGKAAKVKEQFFIKEHFCMRKVYIVVRNVDGYAQPIKTEVEAVFNRKRKAIEHILATFVDKIVVIDPSTDSYSHTTNMGIRVVRIIKECEVY